MSDMSAFDDPKAPIVRFAPAKRTGSHALIGLYGFSGCGKTLSALYIARGLVGDAGKVAMIDTETGRGLIYAMEAGGYDYAELTPPFTPERYTEAIKAAEANGVDCLIIDSSSHEWEGIGGVLEMAEATGKKGLVKWANPKARHKKFVQSMLNSRMHIILCARAKEKMVQVTADNHRKYPLAKVGDIIAEGMVAIQEKRFIYEMTVQIFLPIPEDPEGRRGVPVLEKCPKDLLGAFPPGEQISVETGRRIAEWVAGGEPVDHAAQDLKRTAEDMASLGTERMRAWWATLPKDKQRTLQPELPNLRSIAQTADDEREQQAAAEQPEPEEDDRLSDPFGLPPLDKKAEPEPEQKAEPAAEVKLPDFSKFKPKDWSKWAVGFSERIAAAESGADMEALKPEFNAGLDANRKASRMEWEDVMGEYNERHAALLNAEAA